MSVFVLQNKLEISYHGKEAMGDLVHRYVESLQWVMHYYYSGVASWAGFMVTIMLPAFLVRSSFTLLAGCSSINGM
jgi:Xrn1 helical domain